MTLSSLLGRDVNPGAHGGQAGVWRLTPHGIESIVRFDVGPAVLLVPGEQVLLLTVDLPIASPRRRLESLPFAIEERIGARVDAVHMAIGAEVGPRRYLVGVVDPRLMAGWIALLDEAGLSHLSIIPDPLALPLPPEDGWLVDMADDRAIVRTGDGAGFALPAAQLAQAWSAGGRPKLLASGDPLPDGLDASPAPAALPIGERLRIPVLDLRQGPYARRRTRASGVWRRVGIVAAAGLLAHTTIAAADTLILSNIAAEREAETRALLSVVSPGAVTSTDLIGDAAALLPTGTSVPGPLLPAIGRVSAALAPLGNAFTLDAIRFSGGTLAFDLHAPDAAGFDRAVAALKAAGLAVTPALPEARSDGVHGRIALVGGPA